MIFFGFFSKKKIRKPESSVELHDGFQKIFVENTRIIQIFKRGNTAHVSTTDYEKFLDKALRKKQVKLSQS